MKHGPSTDNRAEHDMTYDPDCAANVPSISAFKDKKTLDRRRTG